MRVAGEEGAWLRGCVWRRRWACDPSPVVVRARVECELSVIVIGTGLLRCVEVVGGDWGMGAMRLLLCNGQSL